MAEQQHAWLASGAPRGADYDEQFSLRLGAENPHGEADFVEDLIGRVRAPSPQAASILDAGCGTGRVGIELARRGFQILGVDNDRAMIQQAQRKAPELGWMLGDLTHVQMEFLPDLAVLAGNVMIFVDPGTEGAVLRNIARHLLPHGLLVAGFSLSPGRLTLRDYDRLAAAAGLDLLERWATWQRATWDVTSPYAVSVHRRV